MTHPLIIPLLGLLTVASLAAVEPPPAGSEPLGYGLADYQPFTVDGAKLIPRVEFLPGSREWERLDVYIPEKAKGDKLPCVINLYGGGYGSKNVGTIRGSTGLLVEAGFVVVTADYALQVQTAEGIGSWDVGAAIRHVRAHAADYRVDPERIALAGWSAGGWLTQFVAYAGPAAVRPVGFIFKQRDSYGCLPTVQPRPPYPDESVRVTAAISDWGAGKLRIGKPGRGEIRPARFLSPDDPPLLTCFPGPVRPLPQDSVGLLQALGVPAEAAFLGKAKNGRWMGTHVPKLDSPGWNHAGTPMTWGESMVDFLDRTLRRPTRCTAPEIRWLPEALPGASARVRLLSAHRRHDGGAIHFTVDGSEPTTQSSAYDTPVALQPGQTIRAIAVRPDLEASPIAAFTVPALPRPVIVAPDDSPGPYRAKAGEPFSLALRAELPPGTEATPLWTLSGRLGASYKPKGERKSRRYPWLTLDRHSGQLTGTPFHAGVFPVIVSCVVHQPGVRTLLGEDNAVADARLLVIVVEE